MIRQSGAKSHAVAVLLLAALLLVLAGTPAEAGDTTIFTSPTTDLTYDDESGILYATSGSKVLRFEGPLHQPLDPIEVGGLLGGIDQSPDRRFLVVADRSNVGGNVRFVLVDLLNGTTRDVTYAVGSSHTGVYSVVFGADGAVYMTFAGGGWDYLLRYDMATETSDQIALVDGDTMLGASGDRKYVGAVTPLIPSPVLRYNVVTHEIKQDRSSTNELRSVALNTDGSRMVVPGFQRCSFFDENMVPYAKWVLYSGGYPVSAAWSAPDGLWIMPWGNSGLVRVVDPSANVVPAWWYSSTYLDGSVEPYEAGRVRVSADGTKVFVAIPYGIRVLDRDPKVTLTPPSSPIIAYGASTILEGSAPTGTKPSVLEGSADGSSWVAMEATTAPSPRFTIRPTTSTSYRLRFPGNGFFVPKVSAATRITPRARLTRSTSWRTLRKGRVYYAEGYTSPKHAKSDSNKVKIRAYKKRADGTWRYVKSFTASYSYYSSTKTRYRAPIKLTSKGRWKLVARHAADSRNATTYGSADYVRVR